MTKSERSFRKPPVPLEIRLIDERSCPQIICDTCGKPLVKDGMVVWDDEPEQPRFYHKGDCDPGASVTCWQELDTFVFYLVHNTKINLESGKERALWGEMIA